MTRAAARPVAAWRAWATIARPRMRVCSLGRPRDEAADRLAALGRCLVPVLLLLFAGCEASVLAAWLPGTLHQWWRAGPLAPGDRPMGDWSVFYDSAKHFSPNGLYNPGLAVIERPLTLLSMATAYRLYVALAALAVLATAFLAQRYVRSPEAKLAVVLGVVALPEMQFALRGAVLTPFLALGTLAGFLLLERHPARAGACFAVLMLKPSFAPLLVLYLVFRRQWRALAVMAAVTAAMSAAGFAAMGGGYALTYARLPFSLGASQGGWLSPTAQTWQHSWPGVLISAGITPRPVLWLELVLLSLVTISVAWRRTDIDTQAAVTALGMLLVTPYAMSYDWALLAVGGVLLLRAGGRARALVPFLLVGGFAAAVLTQAATPYPPPPLVIRDGAPLWSHATYGFYWSAPFALVAIMALAVAGRRARRASAGRPLPVRPRVEGVTGLGAIGERDARKAAWASLLAADDVA